MACNSITSFNALKAISSEKPSKRGQGARGSTFLTSADDVDEEQDESTASKVTGCDYYQGLHHHKSIYSYSIY